MCSLYKDRIKLSQLKDPFFNRQFHTAHAYKYDSCLVETAIASYVEIYTLLFPVVLLHLLCYLQKFCAFLYVYTCIVHFIEHHSCFHYTPPFDILLPVVKWNVWTLTCFSVVSVFIPLISSFSYQDLVTFFLLCRIFNSYKYKFIHAPVLISVSALEKNIQNV